MRTARDMEHVLGRYGDAVWRACLLYLPPSDAEDVFQDAFLKYALHDRALEGAAPLHRYARSHTTCAEPHPNASAKPDASSRRPIGV